MNYVATRDITLEEYLNCLDKPDFGFNELFLVLFAHTFCVHVGVILSNKGFWCSTLWIPSRQCLMIFIYNRLNDTIGKMQLTLCANCFNETVCSCHNVKKNQAKSEYERELINFVNPSDYPEQIPKRKLWISSDVPMTTTHRLGTYSVKVTKERPVTGVKKNYCCCNCQPKGSV